MNNLAIVIPVFNNFNYTAKTIQSLKQLPDDHKIIIIDNGSTDNTKSLTTNGKVIIIRNKENLGFGKACNQGFEYAKNDNFNNIMFLNNDIKISQNNWTNEIIENCNKGFIVGPTIGCLDENFNFILECSKIPSKGFWYMSGWCISASIETWEKLILPEEIGPFNSRKFFAYFEDGDLCFRAKVINIPFSIVKIPVQHIGRMTGKKLNLSNMYKTSRETFLELWLNRKMEIK